MDKKKLLFFVCLLVSLFLIVLTLFSLNHSEFSKKIFSMTKYGILEKSEIELDKNAQNGIVLSPNIFGGWTPYITGNESVLYDVKSLTNTQICIIPKDISLKSITQEEIDLTKPIMDKDEKEIIGYEMKNVTYNYPTSVSMYDISKTSEETLDTKSLTTEKETDNSICFDLDNLNSLLYKLGEESIVILGLSTYNSTDINVTQENKFAHLNITNESLILYLPFDVVENSTNRTHDYSKYNNDGTLKGGTTVINPIFNSTGGVYSGAYKFDAVNDYISIGNLPIFNFTSEDFAFGGWLWHNGSWAGHQLPFGRGDPNAITPYSVWIYDGKARALIGREGCNVWDMTQTVESQVLTNETWNHIFMTKNNLNITMYVNGIQVDTANLVSATICFNKSITFNVGAGDYGGYYGHYWNGSIDEVMVFNRSLSTKEVAQIYNSTFPRFEPTGEMLFQNNNFGTNNTLNITIPNCQQANGSSIKFKINDGNYSTLNSSCMFDRYNLTGNLTNANLTLQLISSDTKFYSPLIVENITLNDYFTSSGTPPTYTEVSINNTFAGQITNFAINVTDETALEPNGMYIFSTNNTGTWINESGVNFTASSEWANVTKTLNSTVGKVIGYQWYFNDSAGNMNATPIYILTTGADCGTLSTAGATYPLTQNVSSAGTCFTISAQNITLDCNNYWINYSIEGGASTYGVVTNQFNTTIKNCNIVDGNWTSSDTDRYGIYLDAAGNSTIYKNFVNVSNSHGIHISSSNNNNLTNNTGISYSNRGIFLLGGLNNTVINSNGVSTSEYGISLDQSNKNNLFNSTGTSIDDYGVHLTSASNNTFNNVTGVSQTTGFYILLGSNNTFISSNGTSTTVGNGITFTSSSNNNLTSTVGRANSGSGITFSSSSNNTLTNNTLISNAGSALSFSGASNNNTLTNNTATSNTLIAILIQQSSNNTFINQIARTLGATGSNRRAVSITSSNNTIFRDCINLSGGAKDVFYVTDAGSVNNTFINCSYNISKETIQGAGNELIRKWYYQAYVNYTNGSAAPDVNVSSFNSSNVVQFTEQTNVTGEVQRKELTEYINRAGTTTFFNNYTINATKTGYSVETHIFNFTITQNKVDDYFTLENNSCVYTSGNWEINCSESCTIKSNMNVGENNISIIGVGTITTTANITNYNKLLIKGTDSSNICRVRCVNGGCFKN